MLHILPDPGPTSSRVNSGGPFVFPSLQALLPSAVMDLDATNAASYPGTGETWSNLIAAPADGSAQSAYDFWLGIDGTGTANPVFSGTADSRAAEFTLNGSQYFTIKANTTLIKNAHKTTGGNPISICVVGYMQARPGTQNGSALWGSGGYDGNKQGIGFGNGNFGSANTPVFTVSGAQGFTGGAVGSGQPAIFDNTYRFLGLTYAPSTTTMKLYNGNNAVWTSGTSFYAATGDATELFQIGAGGAQYNTAMSGFKIVAVSMFNTLLTDQNMIDLRALYSYRHSRSY